MTGGFIRRNLFLSLGALAGLLGANQAMAQTPGFSYNGSVNGGTQNRTASNQTFGEKFVVGSSNLSVSALGVQDNSVGGLAGTNTTGSALLTNGGGTNNALEVGVWRFNRHPSGLGQYSWHRSGIGFLRLRFQPFRPTSVAVRPNLLHRRIRHDWRFALGHLQQQHGPQLFRGLIHFLLLRAVRAFLMEAGFNATVGRWQCRRGLGGRPTSRRRQLPEPAILRTAVSGRPAPARSPIGAAA